jgi:GntR family transcriptional regulator
MITLDPSSAVAPFEQIRSQLADLIRSGDLPAHTRLPAIRQLATDLRVAPGTVAKAYALLEQDGVLESSRARGTRVRPGQAHPEELRAAALAFVRAVEGHTLDDALGSVRAAWASHGAPAR